MTSLARQELFGSPEQTVRLIKSFAIDADEVFCTFIRNGEIMGDVFSVPDSADVTTLATLQNNEIGDGDYLTITFTLAATISGQPVISSADLVSQ